VGACAGKQVQKKYGFGEQLAAVQDA